jgi:hypothetical protein
MRAASISFLGRAPVQNMGGDLAGAANDFSEQGIHFKRDRWYC